MSWMPEQEPTPLRLRLGPRSESPLRPAFEDALGDSPLDPANDDGQPVEFEVETPEPIKIEPVARSESKDPLRAAASEELQRAIEQTSERVERWMADQRTRNVLVKVFDICPPHPVHAQEVTEALRRQIAGASCSRPLR